MAVIDAGQHRPFRPEAAAAASARNLSVGLLFFFAKVSSPRRVLIIAASVVGCCRDGAAGRRPAGCWRSAARRPSQPAQPGGHRIGGKDKATRSGQALRYLNVKPPPCIIRV